MLWKVQLQWRAEKITAQKKRGNELHKMGLGPEKDILEMDIREWIKVQEKGI